MALESWANRSDTRWPKVWKSIWAACPDYKLGAGMEAEKSTGKLDNNPGALKEAAGQ